MKIFLILTAVITCSLLMQAQDYIPFPDSLATWNSYVFESTFVDIGFSESLKGYNYHLEGDTLVNDTTYSKLYVRKSWSSYNSGPPASTSLDTNYSQVNRPYVFIGGIREDPAKKVWYRNMNFENWGNTSEPFPWYSGKFHNDNFHSFFQENSEVMLYDFNMQVGDTVLVNDALCGSLFAVLDSIAIDGILNRKNYLFNIDEIFSGHFTWVQGIGDIRNDPFSRFDIGKCVGAGFDLSKGLSCFWENGSQVYTDEEYGYTDDCEGAIFVGIEELTKQALEIYPNPNSGLFAITLPDLGRSSLTIYNSISADVYHQNEVKRDRFHVDINHLPNGIYMILLEIGEVRYFSKVVKE